MPRKKQVNDYNQTLRDATIVELQKKAKQANQRLRQLEKSGLSQASKAYARIETWSYYQNKEFITTSKGSIVQGKQTQSGLPKFKTTTKGRTTRQLQAQIRQMDIFLNARTSTVKGVKSMYKQAYENFKKKTGYTGSYAEYAEMMAEDIITWAYRTYASEVVTEIINDMGLNNAMDFFRQAKIRGWSENELFNQAFGNNMSGESLYNDFINEDGESIN